MNYESPVRYETARIHAAALYCSDGRVGAHFDDFLHNGLSLPRYDRVSLPGGPACLAGHPAVSLAVVGGLLGAGVAASLLVKPKTPAL